MRAVHTRLVILMTTLFVVLAIAQTAPSTAIVAGMAAVAIAGVVAIRYAAFVAGAREITVGARAHAHREALTRVPSPAHPDTAGRPRTRAPSRPFPAA